MLRASPRIPLVLSVLLAVALATPASSAGVLVVDAAGSGDFTTLSAAVAAAVSGDTILVRNGEYVEAVPIIIEGKSLNVTGANPVGGFLGVQVRPCVVVRNIQPGQRVVLQNLSVQGSTGTSNSPPRSALMLLSNQSHVRVENCEFAGGSGVSNFHPSGAPAVIVTNSLSNAIIGCRLRGGDGQFSPSIEVVCGDGGAGLEFNAGLVALSACDVSGGEGGSSGIGTYPQGGAGGDGIHHYQGSLLVAGGISRGGDGGIAHWGGDGGDGIQLDTGAAGYAWLMGAAVASNGSYGVGDDENGEDGLDINDPLGVVTDWSALVPGLVTHGFDLTSPVREGQPGTLDLQGQLNDSTLLFASLNPYLFPLPSRQGVLLISTSGMIGPIAIGPPGNGALNFQAPALPASLDVLHVYIQPVYLGSDGAILGTGRLLTILDSSF